jgi:hypothetical protein
MNDLLAFDRRPNEYLGILPQLPIMLGGNIFLFDLLVAQGPLVFNMILGHDYVYTMNVIVSTSFWLMHFPQERSIVTIYHLVSDNHHHNPYLAHVSPLYVSSVLVDSSLPRVNYVVYYPQCSIASEIVSL